MDLAKRAGWAVVVLWLAQTPAGAECLGACGDRLARFLMGIAALPVLLIALVIALWFRSRIAAAILGLAIVADAVFLFTQG